MYPGQSMNTPLSSAQLHSGILNQAINQVLLQQIAKSKGLSVSDDEIGVERNKAMGQIKDELSLPPTATESDVTAKLSAIGQSLDTILPEKTLREQALQDKYGAAVQRLAAPSDAAVDTYYTGVHTQHILVSNTTRPDAQALQQAQQIIAQLNKGADFATLAKQYSDDPVTKAKGGDDGFVDGQSGNTDEFMNAARALKPGTYTQTPILSPQLGYYVIKNLGTRDDHPKDFAAKKADYVKQIADAATQKIRTADLDAATKAMNVVVTDPELKGNWLMMQAYKNATNGKPSDADLNTTLAAYDAALKTASSDKVAEIQAQRGMIFGLLNKPDDQLAAFLAEEQAYGNNDPDVALQLGDLYKKKSDSADALKWYQIASTNSYDNVGTHMQLQTDYKALDQPALATQEAKWVSDYNARNKSAQGMPSFGGGAPISVTPH
jgi:parvulin-like peptidyl-prolyl isomerase